MADNVAITPGTGATIATDDIAGVMYQRMKLNSSVPDSTAALDGLTGSAVPAGAMMVGGSDGTNLRALKTNTSGQLNIDTSGAIGSTPPSQANLIGGTDGTNLRAFKTDTAGVQFQQGDVAHGTTNAGNPVMQGAEAIALGTNPTAVAAGTRTKVYANRAGVPFVIGGHPNIVTASARRDAAAGAVTDGQIGPTIATGLKIAITRITVTASNANTVNVAVKIGFGATTLPADSTAGATGVLVDHEGVPPGGGFTIGDGSGILGVGADGEELRWTADVATGGHVICSFSYYTIES